MLLICGDMYKNTFLCSNRNFCTLNVLRWIYTLPNFYNMHLWSRICGVTDDLRDLQLQNATCVRDAEDFGNL